ncbi:MAG: hypothetical protein AABY22_01705 [Nanoarchaeota archaeon]
MAVGMYEELVKNIESAVTELAQIERTKLSMSKDIEELNLTRSKLKEKNKELESSFDEKTKQLLKNKSEFEQRLEIGNQRLNLKEIDLNKKSSELSIKESLLKTKDLALNKLKKEVEVLIAEADQKNLLQSEQLKKVLERLKKVA